MAEQLADINSMCADYVHEAEIISANSSTEATQKLFLKALECVKTSTDNGQTAPLVMFIECQSSQHLRDSIEQARISASVSESTHKLGNIHIKYTPTFDVLRALLAAWHYCFAEGNKAKCNSGSSGLKERDFLIWGNGSEREEATKAKRSQSSSPSDGSLERMMVPDYLFIDGIESFQELDTDMPILWALLNNTLEFINKERQQNQETTSDNCQLVLAFTGGNGDDTLVKKI